MSPALPLRRVASCLVAALLVTAGLPAIASPTPSGHVSFGDGMLTEQRGDVAAIPVHFSDGETATVRIGTGDHHVATVVVHDADADRAATIRLNAYDGTIGVSDGDNLTVESGLDPATPLAVGSYELFACPGNDSGCDAGTAAAATRLVVGERSTDGLQAWVAPESANLSTLDDLNRARDTGNLTRTSLVAKNDTLVLELRASGLEGAIASQDGANVTARFSSWLDSSGVSLELFETTPGAERVALYLNVTDLGATTLISDQRNSSYYLVVDTERVAVSDRYEPTGEQHDLRTSRYRANFTLTSESDLADERESVTDDFEIRDRDAAVGAWFGSERAYVESAPNQTVRVRTTLAPGSNVTVVVDGEGDSFRFEETGRVQNASEDFVVTPRFDFSDVAAGTNFTVTAYHDGKSLMGYGGADPGTVTEPSASVELGRASKLDVGVTAELSYGGFVVVRRGSVDGERLGKTRFLDPGKSETVLVSFDPDLESNVTLVAVAFRDSNGNGDFDPEADQPYTDGEHEHRVATSKTVTFEWSETTTRRTTSEVTTGGTTEKPVRNGTVTTTEESPETDHESPAEPGSGVEIPGFGVGAALAGLVAGVLVALLAGRSVARKRR